VSRRVPYFERPKQPRDWRFWIGGLGKALIALGLLMFAFVAYQLWGTGIQTARSQDSLRGQFDQAMQSTTTSSTTTSTTTTTVASSTPGSTSSTSSTTTTVPVALASNARDGDPIAQLSIPKIHLEWIVVQGIAYHDLKKGPGHFPETPMPGQLGNSAIAGHRTTYGAPFFDLDKLVPGDLIQITTVVGHYTYSVTGSEVVRPEQTSVIRTIDHKKATLTLSTCTPVSISSHRLIIHAELVTDQSSQVYKPPTKKPASPTTTTATATLPGDSAPATTVASGTPGTIPTSTTSGGNGTGTDSASSTDTFAQGWFSDTSAILPSVLWGLVLIAVSLGAYLVGRRYRRLWVCFAVGFAPFVVVLYFFFENVNRLLPPGL
jgi:sortase A